MNKELAVTLSVNGPVVKAENMQDFQVREMVMVGEKKLLGEVISLDESIGTIQVYEETEGLRVGERIHPTDKPLSLTLGPGMIGNIFDGIQRPLEEVERISGEFIAEGIGLISIDMEKIWDVEILIKDGDYLTPGMVYA
nr:V-type ATP synthase subunit A [Proteocatella sp.]